MNITFLLPSPRPSGGVRVTMQMGNCLLERGHKVRIAYRKPAPLSRAHISSVVWSLKLLFQGISETRWLEQFKGVEQPYSKLEDVEFANDEIVIATGIHTIGELQDLKKKVFKVRYCHGLLEYEPEAERKMELWSGPMDTISVSPVLVPALEKLGTGRMLGVVPNGIAKDEYFVENGTRDGIGFVFGCAPVKGPEVALSLSNLLHERFPSVPVRVFGSNRRVSGLEHCVYTRYPSVAKARGIYNQSKIWLVTSRDEGFCLPILEAMACGCAVVSSRHTNAAQLIQDGVNGFTVPYGDTKAYLEVIEQLLTDDALRARVVRGGAETVQQYTWDKAGDSMEGALQKVLK